MNISRDYVNSIKTLAFTWTFSFVSILLIAISYFGGLHLEARNKVLRDSMTELTKSANDSVKHDVFILAVLLAIGIGLFSLGQGVTAGAFCLIISLVFVQNWRKDSLLLKYYDKRITETQEVK